jgi:hypothetical protein
MQHQSIDIDQSAAARAFDSGDRFGQLRMITFFDQRDSCHGLPRINQLVQAVQAVQTVGSGFHRFGDLAVSINAWLIRQRH